jgi:hypothetical protein
LCFLYKNKQGLCRENCTIKFGTPGTTVESLLTYLPNTVYNIYPSISEIYRLAKSRREVPFEKPIYAFSRYFAVNPFNDYLFYKTDLVGRIDNKKQFKLEQFARCLVEMLEESLSYED